MVLLEVIVGLSVVIWLLAVWWQRSARNYWKKAGVPFIPGLPFIGSGVTFKHCVGEVFAKLYNDPATKNEPISGFYFFNKPSLLIRDPELIKRILISDFDLFMDRLFSSDPNTDTIGINTLPIAKGERWKKIRSSVSPVFTGIKLKNFFCIVNEICELFEAKLANETTSGYKEYDVRYLCGFLAIDMLAKCFFGVKAKSLANHKSEFYLNANNMMKVTWSRVLVYFTAFFLPEYAKTFKITIFPESVNKFLRNTINFVMREREMSGGKSKDLIDILITMKNTQPDFFHGDVLVAQASAFLAAGYETSSTAMSFALYLLAKHPDVQENLRKEILGGIQKSGEITYEGMNNLQYLTMVIHETIRLYPSVMILDRLYTPPDNATYSLEPHHSFRIPKGMSIYIPTFGIHRDPKFYPDPEQFNPERFRDISSDPQSKYMYLSFGLGPRSCIGGLFAMIQVKMALITVLKSYRVECCEGTPKKITIDPKGLLLQSKDPINLIFRKL